METPSQHCHRHLPPFSNPWSSLSHIKDRATHKGLISGPLTYPAHRAIVLDRRFAAVTLHLHVHCRVPLPTMA
eukprot:1138171-Pelagomonas_calceolata.AAC.5